MDRVISSSFDRSFQSYASSIASEREEAYLTLEDCVTNTTILPLPALLRKMRDTRYILTPTELVGMGWFARYFISLVVENTTLYRDKYPSIDRETPEAATIGLLEPLDGFTWMPMGQWERVRSVLQLPLESLGFAEEEGERVATRRTPKPTKKLTQKPTTKSTAKPIPKPAPAPSPNEEPPNESSEEDPQERQRSKSIDIPEQAPGESLAENAPQDVQETDARLPDSPPDSDEEMVDMPNANRKRQNQEVLNTKSSASANVHVVVPTSAPHSVTPTTISSTAAIGGQTEEPNHLHRERSTSRPTRSLKRKIASPTTNQHKRLRHHERDTSFLAREEYRRRGRSLARHADSQGNSQPSRSKSRSLSSRLSSISNSNRESERDPSSRPGSVHFNETDTESNQQAQSDTLDDPSSSRPGITMATIKEMAAAAAAQSTPSPLVGLDSQSVNARTAQPLPPPGFTPINTVATEPFFPSRQRTLQPALNAPENSAAYIEPIAPKAALDSNAAAAESHLAHPSSPENQLPPSSDHQVDDPLQQESETDNANATLAHQINLESSANRSWSTEEIAEIAREIQANSDWLSTYAVSSSAEDMHQALVQTVAHLSLSPATLSTLEVSPSELSLQAVIGLLTRTEADKTGARIRKALASVYWFCYLERRIQAQLEPNPISDQQALSNYNHHKILQQKLVWAQLQLDEKDKPGQRQIRRLRERLLEGRRFMELGKICGPAIMAFPFRQLKRGESLIRLNNAQWAELVNDIKASESLCSTLRDFAAVVPRLAFPAISSFASPQHIHPLQAAHGYVVGEIPSRSGTPVVPLQGPPPASSPESPVLDKESTGDLGINQQTL